MAVRVHPFPSRTRQLSSLALTILGRQRPGKISRRQHTQKHSTNTRLSAFLVVKGRFLLVWGSRWHRVHTCCHGVLDGGCDGAGRFFRWGGAFLAAAGSRSCDFWGSLAWPRDFSHSHGWGFFLAALRAVGVPSHSGVPSTCQFCIFRFQTD